MRMIAILIAALALAACGRSGTSAGEGISSLRHACDAHGRAVYWWWGSTDALWIVEDAPECQRGQRTGAPDASEEGR